jgi:hypothetical protein
LHHTETICLVNIVSIIGAQLDTDGDTILVKSFAALVVRIMAMEEKAIGDGLLINQQTSRCSPHLVLQRLSPTWSLQTPSPPRDAVTDNLLGYYCYCHNI